MGAKACQALGSGGIQVRRSIVPSKFGNTFDSSGLNTCMRIGFHSCQNTDAFVALRRGLVVACRVVYPIDAEAAESRLPTT